MTAVGCGAAEFNPLHHPIGQREKSGLAHFHLAAALAQLGLLDEARAAAQAGLTLNPGFTVRRFRAAGFGDNPNFLAGRERMYEGLRMAGVPEG